MADVKIVVSMDSKAAEEAAKRLDNELDKLGKEAGETGKQTQGFGQKLTGLIPSFTVASLAADAIRGALRGVKNALADTVGAAIAQEDADRALQASLELTGRTVAGNYEHYKKFAEAQQLVTKFADNEIQASQALLLQMTRLNQEGIDRATKGAMGLASTMKMDLQSATMLVQKAMEGSFGALSRYGIQVDETLSLDEKRAQLLDKLSVLYGRATADTDTYSGRIAQLKNAWTHAQVEIGNALTKNEAVKEAIATITQVIREMTPEIKEYITGIAAFIGGIAKVTEAAVKAIESVREKIGGMRSTVSESDRAWDSLSKKLGGFSGVVQHLGSTILTLGKYSAESRETVAALGDKLWESFNSVGERATLAAIAAGKFGKDAQAAFRIVGGEMLKYTESLGAAKGKVDEVGKAHETAAGKIKLVATALEAINLGRHRDLLHVFEEQFRVTTKVIEAQLEPVDKLSYHYELLAREADRIRAKNPWDEMLASVQRYAATAGAALGGLDAVIQQGTANRLIAIDNEYSRRLAAINASISDEDARQQAIAKLDDEFAAKRKAAARALGLTTKAIAISNAIISTHEAAAKALAQGGFILGIPWAAIIQALGWIQVALIASQPIPLAQGAYFKRETVLAGRDADYRLADNAGHEEIVSPVPMMRSIVREELQAARSTRAMNVTIASGAVAIYAQTLDDAAIRRAKTKLLDMIVGELRTNTAFAGRF